MALARHVKYLAVARHGEDDGAAALLASHLHWDLDVSGRPVGLRGFAFVVCVVSLLVPLSGFFSLV